jgi:hypothetical protein
MASKKYKLNPEDFITIVPSMCACIASDKITVDGFKVGYMNREESINEVDCGWRFFSGLEDQEYADNPDNLAFYDVNTIANYDHAIIPYLSLPIGTELIRITDTDKFQLLTD